MHKKGEVPSIMGIIIVVIGLVFIMAFFSISKARGDIQTDSMDINMKNFARGLLGCTNINDLATKSVDFNGFINSIKDVYAACDADSTKCGDNTCEKMKLTLPAGVNCYILNNNVLNSYGLNAFVHGPFNIAFIECCAKHTYGWAILSRGQEIDYYNPGDCTVGSNDPKKCTYKSFFAISNGAYVEVRAEQSGWSNLAGTDVIIKSNDMAPIDYNTCVLA